jgi:hypothetical protein
MIKKIYSTLNRNLKKVQWYNLRSLEPVSKIFSYDRGTPIDRVYIDNFLEKNKASISGVTCEIAEDSYSRKYGNNVKILEVFHFEEGNKNATIVGDLTDLPTLPENRIDCFILTQTLNFIYDYKCAIKGVYHMLNKGGVVLATVSGISQISRYDMDRWGDYWRFTDLSIIKSFEEVFGEGNVKVETYGNVLTSTAFLQGISAEELTKEEVFHTDKDYQVTIAVRAVKK